MSAVNYSNYQERDYAMAIDLSTSMKWDMGKENSRARIEACQEAAIDIADQVDKFDKDGVDVYTFSSNGKQKRFMGVCGADKVEEIFEENKPRGGTYLCATLRECFTNYLQRRGQAWAQKQFVKPLSLIIFTDGAAKDQNEVALEIATFTHQLVHPQEVRISFVITMDKDESSKEYQEVVGFVQFLDDILTNKGTKDPSGNLIKAKYDIIDCKSLEWVDDHSTEQFFIQMMTD